MRAFHRPPRFLGTAALGALGLFLGTHLAHAQEAEPQYAAYAAPESEAMPITSESAEAKKLYWMAAWELDNVNGRRAAQHAKAAIELDPALGLAHVIHGFAKPGLQQQERLDQVNAGIAAIAESGTTAEMIVALAYREWLSGNNAAARDLFGAAKKMAPADSHLAFRWALLTGITDGAQQGALALQKVTKKFPESAPAYNNLAYNQWLAGNQQAGMDAVRKYAKLNPGHSNPHDSWAELLQWAGRLDEAAKHYKAAAEIDPEFEQAYLGLAEIAMLKGQPDEARRHIRTAIDYAPSPQARINFTRALGNAYLMSGDWKAAMEQFGKAAAEAEAAGFNSLATLAYRQMALTDAMGDGSAIEAHLAKADEIQGSTNAASHAYAGMAHGMAGNTEPAREQATQLHEKAQGGLVDVAHALSAMLDLESGDATSAMKQLAKADPSDPMVRAILALTYNEMGQPMEAQTFRDQVLHDRTFNFFSPVYPIAYNMVEDL